MAGIKTLYRDYFQKSRIFMYPALEIKRGSSVSPIQTHISWDEAGYYAKDCRLICLYHIKDSKEYQDFERIELKGNPLFEKMIEADSDFIELDMIERKLGVYVFNFDRHDEDWSEFLRGRYSKMTPSFKKKIKEFFRSAKNENYVYVESFLHPEKYYALYAELLGVSMSVLKEVGELTSPPDLDKEALKVTIKDLNKIIK